VVYIFLTFPGPLAVWSNSSGRSAATQLETLPLQREDLMKHCSPEELVELIRGTLTGTQRGAIEGHLHSCSGCAKVMDVYRRVASAASRECSYVPPDGVVRTVKAHFRTQYFAVSRPRAFELLFDSLAQPAGAGARTSGLSARQLLYRVGSVFVDMEIDNKISSRRASLIGQILDRSKPDRPLAEVPVTLVSRDRNIARTSSNQNGEFQFDFAMKSDLQLSVALGDEPVLLPISSSPAAVKSARNDTKRRPHGTAHKKR
jgi:hypothetical protein